MVYRVFYLTVPLLIIGLSLVQQVKSISCSDNQVYAKFVKKTDKWAGEESWQILNGTTVIYSSPTMMSSQTKTIETCITTTTNSQYILRMKDSFNEGDDDGEE